MSWSVTPCMRQPSAQLSAQQLAVQQVGCCPASLCHPSHLLVVKRAADAQVIGGHEGKYAAVAVVELAWHLVFEWCKLEYMKGGRVSLDARCAVSGSTAERTCISGKRLAASLSCHPSSPCHPWGTRRPTSAHPPAASGVASLRLGRLGVNASVPIAEVPISAHGMALHALDSCHPHLLAALVQVLVRQPVRQMLQTLSVLALHNAWPNIGSERTCWPTAQWQARAADI